MTSSAGASGLILARVATELGDGLAHGREVDDAGHAGEVLHDDARRRELDLGVGLGVRVPGADGADVVGGDVGAVLGAQQVLEQHLEAVRAGSRCPRPRRAGRSRRTGLPPRACHGRRSCSCWPPGLPSGSCVVARYPLIYLDVKISNHTTPVPSSLCRWVSRREVRCRPTARTRGCEGVSRASSGSAGATSAGGPTRRSWSVRSTPSSSTKTTKRSCTGTRPAWGAPVLVEDEDVGAGLAEATGSRVEDERAVGADRGREEDLDVPLLEREGHVDAGPGPARDAGAPVGAAEEHVVGGAQPPQPAGPDLLPRRVEHREDPAVDPARDVEGPHRDGELLDAAAERPRDEGAAGRRDAPTTATTRPSARSPCARRSRARAGAGPRR